jgi:TATA-box binding protein (TBP) (component of TFIID and TFIIIB)
MRSHRITITSITPPAIPIEDRFTFKVENVVASGQVALEAKLNLKVLARADNDVEYNPERFPELIMRSTPGRPKLPCKILLLAVI